MSLSTALNAAISGLQVTSRGTQVVADNIANAGTDGYGVRILTQAARAVGSTGSGVIATGVQRDADLALLATARLAKSEQTAAAMTTGFWGKIEQALGASSAPSSLLGRISEFESALTTAIASPDSRAALARVAQSASDITRSFEKIHTTVAQARDQADAEIARQTDSLNALLGQVATLNKDIQLQTVAGGSPNALIDQRQVVTDQIGLILPVTVIPRDHGRIMLLGADGTVLVDQQPVTFSFNRSPEPQAADTRASGGVAPMILGTRQIGLDHPLLGQGVLAAAFSIRDQHAVIAQADIDRLAADLITRFAAPGVDPTVATGAFGLFQDRTGAFPATSVGLSGQIALSAQIAPDDPASWFRLRDGLGASTPGSAGATTLLGNLRDALHTVTLAGLSNQPARDFFGHGAELLSGVSNNRLRAETLEAHAANRSAMLQEQVLAKGVDTDAQMQKLLVLEQSYAANARVITTIDAMMRTLMEI